MLGVAHLAGTLQPVLTTVADRAARTSRMICRQGKVTGANFVQTCVFGWLARPDASLSQLAQMAATCGLRITPQGLDERFTPEAAACLKLVLEAAMREVLAAEPVTVPLLRRFTGVWLWASTTITLPDALAAVWPGCGGRVTTNTRAALKVQVRWELTSGALEFTQLQAGRQSDRAAADEAAPLPPGALRITDLGYVSLRRLTALAAQGVFVLCRLPAHVAVFDQAGRPWAAAQLLAAAGRGVETVEVAVTLGVGERVPCRLVARRVPPAVAARRRRQWRKEAKRAGRQVSQARLALAAWDAYLTTAPPTLLTAAEALVLVRALADRAALQAVEAARPPRRVAQRQALAHPLRGLRQAAGDAGAALVPAAALLGRPGAQPGQGGGDRAPARGGPGRGARRRGPADLGPRPAVRRVGRRRARHHPPSPTGHGAPATGPRRRR